MKCEKIKTSYGHKLIWQVDSVIHREGAPAVIEYTGEVITREKWYRHGVLHKDDGPASVIYYPSGQVKIEEWFKQSSLSRAGAPAIIEYGKDGTIIKEEWWLDGLRHCSNGPAITEYGNGGTVEKAKAWFVNGVNYTKACFTNIDEVDKLKAYSLFTPIEIARLRKNPRTW